MAIEVELPDGKIAEFPDNTPRNVMENALVQYYQPNIKEKAPERGVGTSLGLGTRGVMEGVGNFAGSMVSPVLNLPGFIASGGKNSRTVSPDWGTAAADAMGLPKPETKRDKLLNATISGVASNLPTMGTGAVLSLARQAPRLAAMLQEGPALQAAAGALGGSSAEAAKQGGAGQGAQMLAGMAGGMVPAGLGAAGNLALRRPLTGLRDSVASFTETGRDRLAGRTLKSAVEDEGKALATLDAGNGEILAGSQPTLGQLTGDAGFAALERIAQQKGMNSGLFQERYAAQRAAREAALGDVGDAATGRIAQEKNTLDTFTPQGVDAGTAGNTLRNVYDQNYGAMRQQVGEAYRSIDPEGTARFDLRPLLSEFQGIVGEGRYANVPSPVRGILGTMADDIRNGNTVSYRDLQDVRTQLQDMAQQAAVQGDAATGRMAGSMKRQMDDYLERLSGAEELQGAYPYPKAGTDAYKNAQRSAMDMVKEDPLYDDLAYLYKQGLNREAAQQIVGKAGVETLNTQYPGLVRPSGRLTPDQVAGDLGSGRAYGFGGDDFSNRDSQAMMELIMDRLGSGRGRINTDAAAMRDKIIADNAQPHTGFTPEQAEAFQTAKMMRRAQGAQFESGANLPMSRAGKGLSGQAIDNSSIPANYFKAGPKGREAMTAFNMMAQGNPEALSAMNDYIRNQLRQAAFDRSGVISPAKLAKFQKGYAAALEMAPDVAVEAQHLQRTADTLAGREKGLKDALGQRRDEWKLQAGRNIDSRFGPEGTGTFTADELKRLQDVQRDARRAQRASDLGAVMGSPTARNISAQTDIGRVISPYISRIPMLRMLMPAFENADTAVWNRIQQAVLDPQYAKTLMQAGYKPIVPVGSSFAKYGRATGMGATRGGLLGEFEKEDKRKKRISRRGQYAQ